MFGLQISVSVTVRLGLGLAEVEWEAFWLLSSILRQLAKWHWSGLAKTFFTYLITLKVLELVKLGLAVAQVKWEAYLLPFSTVGVSY